MTRKAPQSAPAWANKIVRSGTRPASEFIAHPDNYRIHPHAQEQALIRVLERVGWVQDVIVSERTGYVIDGHLRVAAALSKGEQTPVPFKEVCVTEAEEALLLSTLDPLSAMAGHDDAKYAELIELLPADMLDIAQGVLPPKTKREVRFSVSEKHELVVTCETQNSAYLLSERLTREGYACRLKA